MTERLKLAASCFLALLVVSFAGYAQYPLLKPAPQAVCK